MNYLLDKKAKEKKFFKIAVGIVLFFILIYFRVSIFNGFSYVSHGIFRPIFILGNSLGEKLGNLGAYFLSKKSLLKENENLQSQILESQADRANYSSILAENLELKEILGRQSEKTATILAAILAKPNQNPYDTLLIDVGAVQAIEKGKLVLAFGSVPIGRVAEVYGNSSKIILFSSAGEKNQTIISGRDIFMELVGRGGGNFEIILPRDLTLQKGDQVILPGLNPSTVAVVETIISDPRNSFTKVLLSSPVNIQELKFVEVEK
jgi:cell shape-determining protein MreC